eukprot:6466238-Amphidinium_carterae.3
MGWRRQRHAHHGAAYFMPHRTKGPRLAEARRSCRPLQATAHIATPSQVCSLGGMSFGPAEIQTKASSSPALMIETSLSRYPISKLLSRTHYYLDDTGMLSYARNLSQLAILWACLAWPGLV